MTTLDHLRIRGYRRLYDVDLTMKPFSVLIGTNGSGKTSFLEVLSLLSAACNGHDGPSSPRGDCVHCQTPARESR
jgi:predicted ATPase